MATHAPTAGTCKKGLVRQVRNKTAINSTNFRTYTVHTRPCSACAGRCVAVWRGPAAPRHTNTDKSSPDDYSQLSYGVTGVMMMGVTGDRDGLGNVRVRWGSRGVYGRAREIGRPGSRPLHLSRTHTNSIRLHLTRTFPSPPLNARLCPLFFEQTGCSEGTDLHLILILMKLDYVTILAPILTTSYICLLRLT